MKYERMKFSEVPVGSVFLIPTSLDPSSAAKMLKLQHRMVNLDTFVYLKYQPASDEVVEVVGTLILKQRFVG